MLTHSFKTPTRPSRAIIFGKNGFISPYLQKELEKEKIDYVALGSSDIDLTNLSSSTKLKSQIRPGDVLIVNAARIPEDGNDYRTFCANLRMAETICDSIAATSPSHVIYISSDSVYGEWNVTIDEKSICNPQELYALMHLSREKMLEELCKEKSIPITVLRPCAVFGVGDTHQSYGPNRFVRTAVREGLICLFGKGEEQRDHILVEDLARLVVKTVLYGSHGVLNLVSGNAVSFSDLAHEIATLTKESSQKNTSILFLERKRPITHRHFSNKALLASFPDFKFGSRFDCLKSIIKEELKQLSSGIR